MTAPVAKTEIPAGDGLVVTVSLLRRSDGPALALAISDETGDCMIAQLAPDAARALAGALL